MNQRAIEGKNDKRLRIAIIIAGLIPLLLSSGIQPTHALQSMSSDPLVMNVRGDLWSWNGMGTTLQQLTTWGYNETPVLSPDGRWVAYRSYARVAVDWFRTIKGGWSSDSDFPTNIWLLNTLTGETSRVVDQPDNASYTGPSDDAGKYRLRSDPVWSPDGKALAWTEFVPYPGSMEPNRGVRGRAELVIFDLASKTSHVIVSRIKDLRNLGGMGGFPIFVWWSEIGLVLEDVTDTSAETRPDVRLLVYSPAGRLLARSPGVIPYHAFWIKDRGKSYLCCASENHTFAYLVDPLTGEEVDLPGVPELYSLTAPDGVNVYPDNDHWVISRPGEPPIPLDIPSDADPYFVISRDGKRVGYIQEPDYHQPVNEQEYALIVYDGVQPTKVATVGNRTVPVWGPMGWRFHPRPVPK